MECKKCGKMLTDGEELCPDCLAKDNENETDNKLIEITTQENEITETNNRESANNDITEQTESKPQDEPTEKNKIDAKTLKRVALIAIISVLLVLSVIFVKDFIKTRSPNAVLEKCIEATYLFNAEEYAKYSTINEQCRQKLGDSDYDYDYEYEQISQAFEELDLITTQNFGSYDVDVEIKETEIFKPNHSKFRECIEEYKEIIYTGENIQAFAKSTVNITVNYTLEGESYSENDERELYSILVGSNWYLIE